MIVVQFGVSLLLNKSFYHRPTCAGTMGLNRNEQPRRSSFIFSEEGCELLRKFLPENPPNVMFG